jgi:hypothetical protein
MAHLASLAAASLSHLTTAMHVAGHPLRLTILAYLTDGPLSPNGLFTQLDDPELTLGKVAYHFRTLAEEEKIRLVRTEQVRGAYEHFYEIADPGCELLASVGLTGLPLRELVQRGLRDRGWDVDGFGYIDPEGNTHASLAAAIDAQTLREAAVEAKPCGCLPAPTRPALADIQAEIEARGEQLKASPFQEPDDEDWAIFAAGTTLVLEELIEAGYDYAARWASPDGISREAAVAAAYICGVLAGELRARG